MMKLLFTFILIYFSSPSYANYYIKNYIKPISTSYNSIGQSGLIHLPNASNAGEGIVGITIGNSSTNQFTSIIASPFQWLEASFFYHRPRDTFYIKKGKYLDKGFNIKFTKTINNIDLALGIDDIGGTGLLSKEYIASTLNTQNFKLTFGVGTGLLSYENQFKNPIPGFEERPDNGVQLYGDNPPGNLNPKTFFRGPVGIFGGIEIYSNIYPGLILKIESNPYDYNNFLAGGAKSNNFLRNRKKSRNFNLGFVYELKNEYLIGLSYIKGNSFDLIFSKKIDFNRDREPVKNSVVKQYSSEKNIELSFYQNILRNLENDSIYLQAANLNDNSLEIAVTNNRYDNQLDLYYHSKSVIDEIAKFSEIEIKELSVTTVYSGIETSTMSASISNPLNPEIITNKDLQPPKNKSDEFKFKTILTFPEFYFDLKPNLIYRYADPTRFFAGGLDFIFNSEIKFSPSFYLVGNYSIQAINSFKRLRYYPDSPYLPHVRTDVVKYLNERSDIYLNNLQLDKVYKNQNDHYLKFSAGYYEMMFGGTGLEYYWKPFFKNFSFGINYYKVKQRNFKQQYKFNNYKAETGHANLMYFHQSSGLFIDLSIGKYLAGDKGYTLDLSRRFVSGFEMGAYFTRTNISKKVYGEGSFDKGIYFKVPIHILTKAKSKGKSNFLIQPLTRDGGAKLKTTNPLIYSIGSGAKYDYSFNY